MRRKHKRRYCGRCGTFKLRIHHVLHVKQETKKSLVSQSLRPHFLTPPAHHLLLAGALTAAPTSRFLNDAFSLFFSSFCVVHIARVFCSLFIRVN
ncbi:hypothetical protein HAX54_023715 [Datura stramonium]|uniref:Uncharacterized protein n=1 Tax=Datura stramonium TaxID=4076 RepID=A0ABS8UXW7_DATST|nr:hypothetical protein [Datura stramonium]